MFQKVIIQIVMGIKMFQMNEIVNKKKNITFLIEKSEFLSLNSYFMYLPLFPAKFSYFL